jgi:formamidopyrimidine-DNA glycosylase
MPELPEVEYLARQLAHELPGRRISDVHVAWDRAIREPAPAEFSHQLAGSAIEHVGRRAKLLLIYLSGGRVLVIHRKMSGNLIFVAPGNEDPWARVTFTLDDGRRLVFSDPRKFGRMQLCQEADLPKVTASLGPEPLEDAFTAHTLIGAFSGRRAPLKALLLDQSIVAGLGNIYADEALFLARLHPLRTGASVTPEEAARLRQAIRDTLAMGIEHGGTTIGRHRDAFNEAGTNVDYLNVYQRTGAPCHVCGTAIARIVVRQRSSHFCPHCQPEA